MTRTLPEWIATHDDAAIPPRVQNRVYMKHNGICPKCSRVLVAGKWACDHIVALVNGGPHRESNLQPLCASPCHSDKTRTDVALKSKTYRVRAKSIGIRFTKPRIQSAGFRKSAPQRTASRSINRNISER